MQPTTTPVGESRQRRRPRRLAALGVSAVLLAACSSGGTAAEPTTTAAPTTTTTTEVTVGKSGKVFQALIEEAQDAITDEDSDRAVFAEDTDVEGAAGSAAGLREDLEAFQADLADLEVPKDAQDALDGVDDTTTAYIEVLAGYEDITEIPDYNDQYEKESAIDADWRDAVAEAADALEVDGLGGVDPTDPGGSSPDDPDPTEPESGSGSSAGLITGDGSGYCLQDGDLPDAFLPPIGKDNMSNALGNTFAEGDEADYADALVASWMVLPEGGASPDDLTADCLIHIFDSPEAAEGFYDAWTADYGAGSFPVPQVAVVADDAPGENPQAYTKLVGDRPTADQIFRYANVVVSVGISGTAENDTETVLAATNDLAKKVYARLRPAG